MSKLKSAFESEEVDTLEVPDGANGLERVFNLYLYTFGDMIKIHGHHNPDYPAEKRIFIERGGEAPRVHPITMSSLLTAVTRKLDFMKMCDREKVEDQDVQERSAIAALIFFAKLGAEQFASTMYCPDKGEKHETVLNAPKEVQRRNIVR
ncbi:hypothetical protein EST38_g12153 [Candolleomyces aberdarensis]|uniref:Uncharacterized protein n=1 Tax=Candolleomyces aberdarensis TaxID=2316362 RepID=A0A4V1Q234_9AGAR|nr:hypothetical protein EST38_g12153 [Candolleomyces aberdarensis]